MKNKTLIIADKLGGLITSANIIAKELRKQGRECIFLSIGDLLSKRDSFSFLYDKKTCSIHFRKRGKNLDLRKEIKSVFYWRPLPMDELDRQKKLSKTEYNFFSNEWHIFLKGIYFSLQDHFWLNPYPANLQLQEKAYQLQLAQRVGLKTPFSLITTSLRQARSTFKNVKSDIVYKTLSGRSVDVKGKYGKMEPQIVFTTKIKRKDLFDFETDYVTPNIFQEYIPKKKEIRVTIVGRAVFAAEVDSQQLKVSQHDWRKGIYVLPFRPHNLPKKISSQCFRLTRKLGLVYSTIDMILTPKGEYVFLELNPNGQYGWIENMTKQPITKNITRMLIEGTINYKIIKK